MSTQSISFPIRGMREACPKCAVDIEHVLTQLDGVVVAWVNYATERARVVYDPARVTALRMVSAIRSIAFDTPLEHQTLHSGDLPYATCARTVEKMLQNVEGVVRVSVDLAARTVSLELFPESHRADQLEHALAGLGLRVDQAGSVDARTLFLFRLLILMGIEFLALWSVGAHAGMLLAPTSLHSPLVVVAVSLLALFGAGWPFYRFAFDAALQGEYDAGVIVALLASLLAVASLPLGLLLPSPWWTDIGFVVSTTLTGGWFLARASMLWLFPQRLKNARLFLVPIALGFVSTLALLGAYLGILSLLQPPSHALEQLTYAGLWVGLVAVGFGGQMGLYSYLRVILRAGSAARATAVTGAGTGTSTLGMLACCAHHLTDIAPLLGLAGASALSGAIRFLTEWKYAFVGLGLIMNASGIIVTLRTIRQSHVHMQAMPDPMDPLAAPACH